MAVFLGIIETGITRTMLTIGTMGARTRPLESFPWNLLTCLSTLPYALSPGFFLVNLRICSELPFVILF